MSNPFTPKPPTPPLSRPGSAGMDKSPLSSQVKPAESPFSRPAGAVVSGAGTKTGTGLTGTGTGLGTTAMPGTTPMPGSATTPGAARPFSGAAAPIAGRSPFAAPAASPLTAPPSGLPRSMPASNLAASKIERPTTASSVVSSLVGMKATDEEFRQLRDFIYENCGIYIADNRKYLIENRLVNRLKELSLKNFSEYYHYLRYDANRRAELTRLFEVVTTNETSFFRNPPQLEVFQNKVLPTVIEDIKATGRKKLRIWSAGCSTGDEPYTIAIILAEVLKSEIASWDIKITASDLSEAVLAAGRRGVYNEYTLRTTPKAIVDKYFHKDGTNYRVDDKLKAMIQFGALNLNDRMQIRRIDPSHIIFCRNVIIYFDDVMKKNVISAFYDNLLPGGYLIIGHSESLHNISRAFQPEHHPSAIMYRRG